MSGRRAISALALAAAGLFGCAGPGGPGVADGAAWASLERPRPAPLAGAPRIAVSDVLVLGGAGWDDLPGVSASVGLQELVSLGLLRRRDVQFVERRRFARAAERERRGLPRPDGAPPVGTSPGAELVLSGTWAPAGPDSAYLDLRLADAATGQVLESWRTASPRQAGLVGLARVAVGGLLTTLEEMERKPSWTDPLASTGTDPSPRSYRDADVSGQALAAFLEGVAAADRYEWERARSAYQTALRMEGSDFFEVDVALARAARLRAGGSLGAS